VVEYNDPEPVEIGQMDLADKTFCKLTVLERNDLDKLNHLRDFLNEKFDGLIKVHLSVPGMLEVFSAQTSKSLAVQIVAAKLKIDLQQVMVFGDSFNDLDMFKTAGRAVAMGNAADFIKRAAHITIRTNDQDGLAHYISTFFSL
jgi:hydroxymethylpyrimidine pyrophosphatase-like HAD family hydrolase